MKVSPLSISIPKNLMRTGMDEEKFEDLKKSMAAIGMINPITVRDVKGKHELVAGYRRLKAAKALRWQSVEIREMKANDKQAEALKVAENADREEVSPMDEGKHLAVIMEAYDMNQKEVAHVIGRSEAYVSKRLLTKKWPERLKMAVERKIISFSGATELMRITSPDYRDISIEEAIKFGASPSTIKTWVETWNARIAAEMMQRREEGESEEPRKLYESMAICGACGGRHPAEGFQHVAVDAICFLLMQEAGFQALMTNNRLETIQVARGKTLATVFDKEDKKKEEGEAP